MTQGLSGPGLGLPLPQNLYPSALSNAPYDTSSNRIGLAPGDELPIPAGDWYVTLGNYCVLEYLDPITNTWTMGPNAAWLGGIQFIKSDGFTVRVANRLGCPVSASVAAYGSGYVQASTTVTAVGSTSTWAPLVGGQLSASVSGVGAGYGVPPIVFIPPPAPAASNSNGIGGIPAHGYATIANGTVSGFTFTNPGAGYQTAPTAVVLPNPTDPNISTGITAATIVLALAGSGSVTGALCTNPGAAITPANITLTIAGAGTNATLTPNVLQTVTTASIIGTGTGYGTVAALLTTAGGAPVAGTVTNGPEFLGLAWRPRPAQVTLTVNNSTLAAQVGTIVDGGMFLSAPNPVLAIQPLTGTGSVATSPTLSLTMGSRADFVILQPGP